MKHGPVQPLSHNRNHWNETTKQTIPMLRSGLYGQFTSVDDLITEALKLPLSNKRLAKLEKAYVQSHLTGEAQLNVQRLEAQLETSHEENTALTEELSALRRQFSQLQAHNTQLQAQLSALGVPPEQIAFAGSASPRSQPMSARSPSVAASPVPGFAAHPHHAAVAALERHQSSPTVLSRHATPQPSASAAEHENEALRERVGELEQELALVKLETAEAALEADQRVLLLRKQSSGRI